MKPDTTVVMLNYRRPNNVRQILTALRDQLPRPDVWLWNNGMPAGFDADWLVESTVNRLCPPRWWMAAQAETEYVVILDDDVLPIGRDAIRRVVAACEPGRIAGPWGAVLERSYHGRRDVGLPVSATEVDVVKGRCMAMHTTSLREAIAEAGVLTARGSESRYDDLVVAEDIAICGAMASGRRRHHLVPGGLAACFRDLAEGAEALSRRADHLARRDRVAARWFP